MGFKRLALTYSTALAVLAAVGAAHAQPSQKIPRLGLLFAPSESAHAPLREAFMRGLQEHGYVEGRTILIEKRYADGNPERLPQLAGELVKLKVDVIVTAAFYPITAARQATTTIPIVFAATGDPVAAGHVSSLARPGGNITGFSLLATDTTSKRLQLLRELSPRAQRVALLFNPEDFGMAVRVAEAQSAARALGMAVVLHEIRGPQDFERAFAAMMQERPDALLAVVDAVTLQNRGRIIDFAAGQRIAAIYETGEFVQTGGLMSYGPALADNYRRAAGYVDRILKGARPADLPVQQPSKIELVINAKAARELGLPIPQSVLLRADRIFE
jgi:putative tryptophan/tyrosine transport system substrate-binding protein